MVIYLGWPSPATSSSLPAAWRCGSHLAAYLALLRLGVTLPPLLPVVRWALTPPFHPYPDIGRTLNPGGFFSVALSVALRRPGVTWQPTLWSSDFPRCLAAPATICPTSGLNIAEEEGSGEAPTWQELTFYHHKLLELRQLRPSPPCLPASPPPRLPASPPPRLPHPACPTRARPCSACCRNGSSVGSARFHCASTWRYCSRASALRPSRS